MLTPTTHRTSSYEARMLAAADRLFAEFEQLPVATVFRAICSARSELREHGDAAVPEEIEQRARRQLTSVCGPS